MTGHCCKTLVHTPTPASFRISTNDRKIGPVAGDRALGTGTAAWWMYVMNDTLKCGIPQLGAKEFKTG